MTPSQESIMKQDQFLVYEYNRGKLGSDEWGTPLAAGWTFGLLGWFLLSIFAGPAAGLPAGIIIGLISFALLLGQSAQKNSFCSNQKSPSFSRLLKIGN
jgi:hypothetical protein